MNLRNWLKSWDDEKVADIPIKKSITPIRSPYIHRGFLVTSTNYEALTAARHKFIFLWNEHHRKSKLAAPVSEVRNTFNDHQSFAIFPCGGNQMGLTYSGETYVHDLFEEILHTEFENLQWIRFMYDHESASIAGHTGAK